MVQRMPDCFRRCVTRVLQVASTTPLAIEITARVSYPIVPLPAGDAYLGFIFARGARPETVEAALRAVHAKLRFEIVPDLPRVQ